MPFTVITLKKVPPSLRGDLTKWMQEVDVGVYVGNFSTRIRERLWDRILDLCEDGSATMSYSTNNEIGYDFKTNNSDRSIVDYDGIPLIMVNRKPSDSVLKSGFSKAAKYRKATVFSKSRETLTSESLGMNTLNKEKIVAIDIETDGLDPDRNVIIELGAAKYVGDEVRSFSRLIKYTGELPKQITELTGIKNEDLKNAYELTKALKDFCEFIGDRVLIGYNIVFDLKFIGKALDDLGLEKIENRHLDIANYVKKESKFLEDYKLATVIRHYEIDREVDHRASSDASLVLELALKIKKFRADLDNL